LFRLDVRCSLRDDINKKYTASKLKEIINKNLQDKDVKVVELRFTISKTAEVVKFEENLRNRKVPEWHPGFNQIKGNKFIDEVFGDMRMLNKN
jgi:hypothetical protein